MGYQLTFKRLLQKIALDFRIGEPNKLVGSLGYSAFSKKQKFFDLYNTLNRNGCKILKGNFSYADEYDNKGECYRFSAKMYQRLDRTKGLAIYYNGYAGEGNLFYAIFNKS